MAKEDDGEDLAKPQAERPPELTPISTTEAGGSRSGTDSTARPVPTAAPEPPALAPSVAAHVAAAAARNRRQVAARRAAQEQRDRQNAAVRLAVARRRNKLATPLEAKVTPTPAAVSPTVVETTGTAAGSAAVTGGGEQTPAEGVDMPFRATFADMPRPRGHSAFGNDPVIQEPPLPLLDVLQGGDPAELQATIERSLAGFPGLGTISEEGNSTGDVVAAAEDGTLEPPDGWAVLTDSDGNYIADSQGNPVTVSKVPADAIAYEGSTPTFRGVPGSQYDADDSVLNDDDVLNSDSVLDNDTLANAVPRGGGSGFGEARRINEHLGPLAVPAGPGGERQGGLGPGEHEGSPQSGGTPEESHREPRTFRVSISDSVSVDAVAVSARPAVPPQRSAAIQPVWVEDRLVVPREAAGSDLPQDGLMAAYAAARIALQRAIETLAGANADPRIAEFARGVLALVPESPPDQVAVFVLALELEAFQRVVAQSVDEGSLSAEQAARLETAARHLERCVNQHPTWREFNRNAAASTLTAEQIEDAPKHALALAEEFAAEEVAPVVDWSVTNALRNLANSPIQGGPAPSKDIAAFDLVESLGNIIAKLAERALLATTETADLAGKLADTVGAPVAAAVAAVGRPIGQGAQEVAKAYRAGVLEGVKTLGKVTVVGVPTYLLGQAVVARIVSKYPVLADLKPLLEYILTHAAK